MFPLGVQCVLHSNPNQLATFPIQSSEAHTDLVHLGSGKKLFSTMLVNSLIFSGFLLTFPQHISHFPYCDTWLPKLSFLLLSCFFMPHQFEVGARGTSVWA